MEIEMATMKRSTSYQNGEVTSSRGSSLNSVPVRHSISFPTALDVNAGRIFPCCPIITGNNTLI